jgi:uroporphyrinogen III methyltransferase/synthase
MSSSDSIIPGKVYLVGAGPGDPGLITLRGAQCLGRADLVLYDYLANASILTHAAPSVELVPIGHAKGPWAMSQQQIQARMIDAARLGKTVVRLKGGDPAVFGRVAEETAALKAAGITYEVVPGVTAALAAAVYAEIPITHGQRASAVAFITGQERTERNEPGLDYEALAHFPGTLVLYMGVTTAHQWSDILIRHGKSPQTPAAVILRATRCDQEVHRTTLRELPQLVARRQLQPPAIVIVGDVVDLAPPTSWFAARPLFGRRILVTRPRDQADGLCGPLADLGAEVIVQPAIAIDNPPDWEPVDAALARLDQYDWLVFSSANGVRALLDRLCAQGGDLRRLGAIKIAAIGPGTAEALARYHLRADLLPEQFRAESLADALRRTAPGQRFLLARASRGRQVLPEQLAASGGRVEQIVVYSSSDVPQAEPEVAELLAAGRVDWVTVTSSSIARALAAMFGPALRRSSLASISPVTSDVLRELGYPPAAEASTYTMEGLVASIIAREASANSEGRE